VFDLQEKYASMQAKKGLAAVDGMGCNFLAMAEYLTGTRNKDSIEEVYCLPKNATLLLSPISAFGRRVARIRYTV